MKTPRRAVGNTNRPGYDVTTFQVSSALLTRIDTIGIGPDGDSRCSSLRDYDVPQVGEQHVEEQRILWKRHLGTPSTYTRRGGEHQLPGCVCLRMTYVEPYGE